MIGAPTKFSVEASTVGDGDVDEIVLRNSRTSTKNDTYTCAETPCIADLSDETGPAEDTFAGNATADYLPRNIYNIEAAPDGSSNTKTESESVEVYKKGDVNHTDDDAGNVTLNDVNSMLDARGQEAAGGLPWEQNRQARYDVNNDGEIDIVDVTIVVEEYSP
jgi:hypothetical protein